MAFCFLTQFQAEETIDELSTDYNSKKAKSESGESSNS